jgi:hypothetical protein
LQSSLRRDEAQSFAIFHLTADEPKHLDAILQSGSVILIERRGRGQFARHVPADAQFDHEYNCVMSDKPAKTRLRWIGGAAGALLLLLAAIVVAPLVLTTQLVRIAVMRSFPGNTLSVGHAALSLSGALTLRDVALSETVGQRPLVAIREVEAAFDWRELVSRRIRKIEARGVTLYAGTGSRSQIGLLDLLYERSRSNPAASSNNRPLWIDALNVQGKIQAEPVKDIVLANTDWPLTLQMTMSGDRMEPSRQFRVAIGETRRLREKIPKEPSVAADASFGLLADVETRAATGGTRVIVRRLVARQAALAIDADTLRHYVPGLLRELHGRIETGLGGLSAAGELDAHRLANQDRLAGSISFAGFRVHTRGKSQVVLNLDDMAGVAKIDTPLPPKLGTAITMERLRIRNAEASIPADDLRRYITRLPPDLHGLIYAHLGALELSGLIGAEPGYAVGFNGNIGMHELSVHSPLAGGHAFALQGLTSTARIESPLYRWTPAALKVREGVTQWASLTYGTNAVYNLDASWRIEGNMLTVDRFTARIFDGTISGSPALDLVTHEMPPCDFQISSINVHQALTNISPEHVDAEGNATGSVHLMLSKGELAGHLNLAFDGPGVLRVGQIEEVKRMLAGNFGLDMANLAMHDLEHYPFDQGSLYLESVGSNSQLKIRFVRQARTKSDVATPRKEIINGNEVLVRSLVVPTIDMTIPITGKSLAEILAMASGISPLVAVFSEQAGK